MARIRTIKPELPHSESLGSISRDARLTFILLFTLADDIGRLRGSSRMLASLLFPYDDDAPKKIGVWLDELESKCNIIRYQVDGQSYIQICNWLNHQKIDRPSPSKLPDPNIIREDSRGLDEDSRGLVVGREGKGVDQGEEGRGEDTRCPSCPVQKIIDLYHQTLPTLPRVVVRTDERDGFIRGRWKDFFESEGFKTQGEGLLIFERYFNEMVKPSDFLLGRVPGRDGGRPFTADLEWITRPNNFAKIIEGKYIK